MCCYLDHAGLDVIVHDILPGSREPKEHAMVDMGVAFRWSVSLDFHCNRGTKSLYMFHAWYTADPMLVQGHLDFLMVDAVKQIAGILDRIDPKFSSKRTAV